MATMKTSFSPAVRTLETFKYPALCGGIFTSNITDIIFFGICGIWYNYILAKVKNLCIQFTVVSS